MNPNKRSEIQLDSHLEDLLTDLRAEHHSIQPPASLEASIIQQARLASTPRRASTIRVWAFSLAGAAALIFAIIALSSRPSHPAIQTGTVTPLPPPKSVQMPTPISANQSQTLHPRPQQKKRRAAPHHQSTPGLFVPLPNGVGLPEPTEAMLIRTRIQTSSLQSYGLTPPPPGAPTTVLADILIGEDGLPRAIRLVP